MGASDLWCVRSCKHCSIETRTKRRACGKSRSAHRSNPATLTPVGYLQFETGVLGATDSPEFSTRYEFNEVIKLAVLRRLEFIKSEPLDHYTAEGIPANRTGEIVLGAQVVLMPGEGTKPTLAVSYSHRLYDGGAPELDSSVLYASADVKGFHYDANAICIAQNRAAHTMAKS